MRLGDFAFEKQLGFDFNVDAGCDRKNLQLVDRIGRWVHDVEKADMSAHFELLARFAVDVRRAENSVDLPFCRKRDWSSNTCARSFCRLHDVLSGSVEHALVVAFKADTDLLF